MALCSSGKLGKLWGNSWRWLQDDGEDRMPSRAPVFDDLFDRILLDDAPLARMLSNTVKHKKVELSI